jgi:hypothetical protein
MNIRIRHPQLIQPRGTAGNTGTVFSDFTIAEVDEYVNVLGDHGLLITVRKIAPITFRSAAAIPFMSGSLSPCH